MQGVGFEPTERVTFPFSSTFINFANQTIAPVEYIFEPQIG
jgi:hypothetical protein